MAICRMIEAGATPEQYEQIRGKLGLRDPSSPPPGASLHLAAQGEDGKMRIVEVWESRDEAEAWGEKVKVARQEVGVEGAPKIVYYELHTLAQA
jgi:hypothetical protein